MHFKSVPSPSIRFLWFNHPSFPSTVRETSWQMEISFKNVHLLSKRVTSTPFFRVSPLSVISQNNQLKITPFLRGMFWDGISCHPSIWSLKSKEHCLSGLEDTRQEKIKEKIWRGKNGKNWCCWFEDGEKGPEAEEYGWPLELEMALTWELARK